MLNPIFHVDSVFMSQAPDYTFSHLQSVKKVSLLNGTSIQKLSDNQHLMKITTESGAWVIVSPETVFSLMKTDDGRLCRFLRIQKEFIQDKYHIDWTAPITDFGTDIRRFALIGMIVANGRHSMERSRPSNVTLPRSIGQEVLTFLTEWSKEKGFGLFSANRNPSVTELDDGTIFIKSRLLSWAADPFLTEKDQTITFDPSALTPRSLWAFAYGFINAVPDEVDSTKMIRHRGVETLIKIQRVLEHRLGVSSSLSVSSYEKEVMTAKGERSHSLRFDATALAMARRTGLIHGVDRPNDESVGFLFAEKITGVEALKDRHPSVIVTGEANSALYMTANTFVFESEFEPNSIATELAAHPSVMIDPSDPTGLLEKAFKQGKI